MRKDDDQQYPLCPREGFLRQAMWASPRMWISPMRATVPFWRMCSMYDSLRETAQALVRNRFVIARRSFRNNHGAFSLPAQHPCTQPCHAPSVCPEIEPCSSTVTITCACGRIRQPVLCGRSVSSPAGREAALTPHCTNECEIAKRNARLAEALGINPDTHKTNRNVTYSDELLSFARHNGKFVELVEKTIAEYVCPEVCQWQGN
jgi:hypothetical protein